ncbi:MAG: type III pantothenate kinase [Solobacterium sp.]|nr:type III pantothenate kinase [Solobacterium sp.]
MLLTIDAGNTNIALGLMDGDKVVGTFRLITKTPRTSDEFVMCFNEFFETQGFRKEDVEDTILSSVVPKVNYALSSAVIKYLGKMPIIITKDTDTGISLDMPNPSEVGADLIVDCAMAYLSYHRPCIIIDFGTATTYTYVSGGGHFPYVAIQPGLRTSADALTGQAAQLPEIEIRKPETVLGYNTITAMQAGIMYGYIGSVEYIIKAMKEELHEPECYVIATGGLGRAMTEATDLIDEYDPDVAYKGMYLIYQRMKKA